MVLRILFFLVILSFGFSESFGFSGPFGNSQKNITSFGRGIDTLYQTDIHPIDWQKQSTFTPSGEISYRSEEREKFLPQTNILTSQYIQLSKIFSGVESQKNQYYIQRDDGGLFASYFSLTTIPDPLLQLKYHLGDDFHKKWNSGNIYLYGSEHICDDQQVIYDWGKNIRYCRKGEKNPGFFIQNTRHYYTYSTDTVGKHTFQFSPVLGEDIIHSFEGKKLPEYILVDTPKDIGGMLIKTLKNHDYAWTKDVIKKYEIYKYQNTNIILPYYEVTADIEKSQGYLHLDFVQVQPLHRDNTKVQSDTYEDAFGITFEVY